MIRQCTESASATEPEDNAALNLLESYGALRTPNFDVVTSRMSREHFVYPYPPTPSPRTHPQPTCPPTNPFVSPPFSWVPQSPGIEATNHTALAEKRAGVQQRTRGLFQ